MITEYKKYVLVQRNSEWNWQFIYGLYIRKNVFR